MLRLLLHFVGDLHQPLHGATLFDEIFPEGDRAGNFFPIYMGEAKTNLHAAWDSGTTFFIRFIYLFFHLL